VCAGVPGPLAPVGHIPRLKSITDTLNQSDRGWNPTGLRREILRGPRIPSVSSRPGWRDAAEVAGVVCSPNATTRAAARARPIARKASAKGAAPKPYSGFRAAAPVACRTASTAPMSAGPASPRRGRTPRARRGPSQPRLAGRRWPCRCWRSTGRRPGRRSRRRAAPANVERSRTASDMVPKSGEDGGPHAEAIGEPPHHRRQEGQGHGPGVSTNPAARARARSLPPGAAGSPLSHSTVAGLTSNPCQVRPGRHPRRSTGTPGFLAPAGVLVFPGLCGGVECGEQGVWE
jgi:hypothetical protein